LSIEEFGYEDQLHRALTTKDLVIYGLIFMVPIAPYSVFGFVYNDAKGMVPLAYLVGLGHVFYGLELRRHVARIPAGRLGVHLRAARPA